MSGSFKNPAILDDNMTSNDYINSKKNKQLFCDINNSKSKVHKVKGGKLSQTANHSTLMAMTKGYFDYYLPSLCYSSNLNILMEKQETTYNLQKQGNYRLLIGQITGSKIILYFPPNLAIAFDK